jgi:hypothetical protein
MAAIVAGGILGLGAINDAIHGENPLDRFTKIGDSGVGVLSRAPSVLDTGINTANEINKILPLIVLGFGAIVLVVLLKK